MSFTGEYVIKVLNKEKEQGRLKMKIETKIRKLVKLREEILEDSKKWKGGCCPLKMYENKHPEDSEISHSHYGLSQLFAGLGCWGWNCPFCNEEFQE